MTDFEPIYRTYFGPVYRYLRGLCGQDALAEDLTAETFLKAMTALDGYKGECSLQSWLCGIGRNCWIDWLRRHKREQPQQAPPLPDDPGFEDALCDGEDAMRLHRLLHALPEPYKEVFSLRVFGELSFARIGALFGKSENWACVTYHRAKQKIRQGLEREP